MKKRIVEFKNINKNYKDVVAVKNFNLEIKVAAISTTKLGAASSAPSFKQVENY